MFIVIGVASSRTTYLPALCNGSFLSCFGTSDPSTTLRYHRCLFAWYRKLEHRPPSYAMVVAASLDAGVDVESRAGSPWYSEGLGDT